MLFLLQHSVPDACFYLSFPSIPEHLSLDQYGRSGAFDSPSPSRLDTRRALFDPAGVTTVTPSVQIPFLAASCRLHWNLFPSLRFSSGPMDLRDLMSVRPGHQVLHGTGSGKVSGMGNLGHRRPVH